MTTSADGQDRYSSPHAAGKAPGCRRPRARTANRADRPPRHTQPAAIGREIADLQTVLLKLAKDKTEQLYLASIPSALPDIRAGVRIKNQTAC